MQALIKSKQFTSHHALVDFVNGNGITKENIQSIIMDCNTFIIFYWEIEIWK